MKIRCLSCSQEMNMDHQAFSNFRGSIKCVGCRGVMELQTIGGVLIWGYPSSDVSPDFAGRTAEPDLQGEQDMLRTLQSMTGYQAKTTGKS
jgi:hypothetical protein